MLATLFTLLRVDRAKRLNRLHSALHGAWRALSSRQAAGQSIRALSLSSASTCRPADRKRSRRPTSTASCFQSGQLAFVGACPLASTRQPHEWTRAAKVAANLAGRAIYHHLLLCVAHLRPSGRRSQSAGRPKARAAAHSTIPCALLTALTALTQCRAERAPRRTHSTVHGREASEKRAAQSRIQTDCKSAADSLAHTARTIQTLQPFQSRPVQVYGKKVQQPESSAPAAPYPPPDRFPLALHFGPTSVANPNTLSIIFLPSQKSTLFLSFSFSLSLARQPRHKGTPLERGPLALSLSLSVPFFPPFRLSPTEK